MFIDFSLLVPEFLLAGLGFLVLAMDLVVRDHQRNIVASSLAAAGLAGIAAFSVVYLWDEEAVMYGGIYFVDNYALFFKGFFPIVGMVVVLMSVEYVGARMRHPGEYYTLLVFSILGAVMLASTGELLTAFISLEVLSFSLLGQPAGATFCYAWEVDGEVTAVLHEGPVDSPLAAVRAAIMADAPEPAEAG